MSDEENKAHDLARSHKAMADYLRAAGDIGGARLSEKLAAEAIAKALQQSGEEGKPVIIVMMRERSSWPLWLGLGVALTVGVGIFFWALM